MTAHSHHIQIDGRTIGHPAPCFIIAEAGVNHNGDLQEAYRLVDAAVSAGVDAIKFQSFIPEKLVTSYAAKAAYQQRNDPEGTTQLEMLKALELNQSQHQALQHYCVERGLLFLSTPFDEESADMLLELGVPLFKIGSGDLTNAFLLAHVARLGRPIILSTGMSNMRAVEDAVHCCGRPVVRTWRCFIVFRTIRLRRSMPTCGPWMRCGNSFVFQLVFRIIPAVMTLRLRPWRAGRK